MFGARTGPGKDEGARGLSVVESGGAGSPSPASARARRNNSANSRALGGRAAGSLASTVRSTGIKAAGSRWAAAPSSGGGAWGSESAAWRRECPPLKGQHAGEQLEGHHTQRVDAAARIQRAATRLLGAHVLGAADHVAAPVPLRAPRGPSRCRSPSADASVPVIMRFSVVRSRWTTPAGGSPPAPPPPRPRTAPPGPGRAVPRRRRSRSVRAARRRAPSAMKRRSASSPYSCTRQTSRCVTRRASLISDRKRACPLGVPSQPRADHLDRHVLVERAVVGAIDRAHTAASTRLTIWSGPAQHRALARQQPFGR